MQLVGWVAEVFGRMPAGAIMVPAACSDTCQAHVMAGSPWLPTCASVQPVLYVFRWPPCNCHGSSDNSVVAIGQLECTGKYCHPQLS